MTPPVVVPTPAEVCDRAYQQTGLADMGDAGWQQGLEVLLESARADGALSDVGLAVFRSWIHARLVSRLRIVDWSKKHLDEVSNAIVKPLVVTGLGRSGTTFLLELLTADRANRALMKWEALDAVPPPESSTFDTDPRIARSIEATERTYDAVPDLRAVHYERGDGPTECLALLGQSFRGPDFAGLFTVPTYSRWWLADDQRPAYTFHRRALGVLQSRAPGAWVLKDPWHVIGLDALFETYPDARVVVLHRDPVSVVPSMAGLSVATRPDVMRTSPVPPSYWGRQWLDALGVGADRLREARTRLDQAAFLDVQYDEFTADPVGTVDRIYRFAGRAFTAAAEAAVAEHVNNRPQHQFGVHRYSLAEFGLTEDEVRERFAGS